MQVIVPETKLLNGCEGASGRVYNTNSNTFTRAPDGTWNVTTVDPLPMGTFLSPKAMISPHLQAVYGFRVFRLKLGATHKQPIGVCSL